MKNEIGLKIRQIRELKGYSQEFVASKLGLSQRAYSKLETAETKLDWTRITEIADIFEVTPTDILTFDDNLIFNNCSQSGKFQNFTNNYPEKLIEIYEARINELKEEILFLRQNFSK